VADPLPTAFGAPIAGALADPQPLAERIAAIFLVSHRRATRAAYRASLQAWRAWCVDLDVDVLQIEKLHVETWVRQLEEDGAAPATVVRHLAALHGFYREAVEMKACPRDPTERVRRPRLGRDSLRAGLSREQAQLLLAAAADSQNPRDEVLVCLLLLNGLRISEALALNFTDITEVRGHLVAQVVRKGGIRQHAALAPKTTRAIDTLLEYERMPGDLRWLVSHDHITVHDRPILRRERYPERRLDRWRAADLLQRVAVRANLKIPVTPDVLRQTFAALALDAGAPLRDVQDAAGHADPSTTRRYDRTLHSLDRYATYTLAAWLGDSGAA
jgi:site-specific recombinase XerD